MTSKDYYKLASKHLKKEKIRRNIFIIVISLFLLIVLVPFTVYKMFSIILDKELSVSNTKTVEIYDVTDDDIEYLKKYKNDNVVKIDYSHDWVSGFINFEKYENIHILETIDKHTPNVINGKEKLSDFEMLCPTNIAYGLFDDLTYGELIETKLGDVYKLEFIKYLDDDNYKKYEHEFKIVSQFNPTENHEYNSCYVNSNTYEIVKSEQFNDNYNYDVYIYAKDRESALQISSELALQGMYTNVPTPDTEFMGIILDFGIVLTIFISVASFIAISIYFYSYFKSEYKRLALYKALGYNYKEITEMMVAEINVLIIIAFIIDVILFIILAIAIETILYRQVQFREIIYIRLPIIPFIIYFLLLIINSRILVRYEVDKIKKLTVRELNEE